MRKWNVVIGAEMGGCESGQHEGRHYQMQTKELKSVAAGAAQWLHIIVHDSCPWE